MTGLGEQTFMKDAKTIGGIKDFATQESAYGKWVLNRSAKQNICIYVPELSKQADNPRKCFRTREIDKSEKAVKNIKYVLSNDFINPFSIELDTDKLYNLASGRPVTEDIRECLLSFKKRGKVMMKKLKDRLCESKKNLFYPITKAVWQSFEKMQMKTKVKVNGKSKDISIQRYILGLIVAASNKEKSDVDIEKALTYPLAPVSLPLAFADGAWGKAAKGKILENLPSLDNREINIENLATSQKVYILDLVASIHNRKSSECL